MFSSIVVILQKQSKDRFGLDGDEESTMLEESVSPKKSVEISVLCFSPSQCHICNCVVITHLKMLF